jgi:simple sugar transport system permease protein
LIGRLAIERRSIPPRWFTVAVPVVAVLAAALVAGAFLALGGNDPIEVYRTMLDTAFGSWFALTETLVEATPLILTGLAAAIAFKLQVWNIGGEGQLYVGAIVASGVAFAVGERLPTAPSIALLLIAGAVGGGFYALLAGAPRAYWGTDEVVMTLMFNFVALNLVNYLVFGSASAWRDPVTSSFPQGRFLPESFDLPVLSHRLDMGLFVGVGAGIIGWWALRRTRWGFGFRVVGDSRDAARYAGINARRKIIGTFFISGAFAGLAGAVLVGGPLGAFEPRGLTVGLGFAGILVAAMARFNLLAVLPTAVFVAGVTVSGPELQSIGVPTPAVVMVQGTILLFVAAGEFVTTYRVRRVARHSVVKQDEAVAA